MATLNNFDQFLNRILRELPGIRHRGLLRLTKRVGHDLIDSVPIKTGRLANNWVASTNPAGSSYYNKSARGSRGTGKMRFDRTVERLKKLKLDNIYLSNATPYGGYAVWKSGRNIDAEFRQSAQRNLARLRAEFIDEINRLKK